MRKTYLARVKDRQKSHFKLMIGRRPAQSVPRPPQLLKQSLLHLFRTEFQGIGISQCHQLIHALVE